MAEVLTVVNNDIKEATESLNLAKEITDKTFCCQTEIEIKINDVVFWTYFYETDNCEKIPALEEDFREAPSRFFAFALEEFDRWFL
jgi:hypothetical protein